MKKIYKILLGSLMSVLLLFAPVLSVSASEVTDSVDLNGLNVEYIYLKVSGYTEAQDWASTIDTTINGSAVRFEVRNSVANFPADTTMTVDFYMGSMLTNPDYVCYGNYSVGTTQNNSVYTIDKVNISERYTQDEDYNYLSYQKGTPRITTYNNMPCVTSTFTVPRVGVVFEEYHLQFDIHIEESASVLYFYLFSNNLVQIDLETNKIINNQNSNTDKILNGDEDLDSSQDTDKIDGAVGDMDSATDEALGGKSDEEIQAEVEESLDPDKIGLDFTKANRISSFFDNCLTAFGDDYKTLILLSLSLGLGAFLIGRRYG